MKGNIVKYTLLVIAFASVIFFAQIIPKEEMEKKGYGEFLYYFEN